MALPPAFVTPCPLPPSRALSPRLSRLPRPPRPRRPSARPRPRVPAFCAARKATLFSTGQRLVLVPTPPDPPPSATRYILCPSCSAAYVGNAVRAPLRLVCLRCAAAFVTSPTALYLPAPPVATASDAAATAAAAAADADAIASPAAQPPDGIRCPHFAACPGCTLDAHVSRPPVVAAAAATLRRLGVPGWTSLAASAPPAWRTHAKLAVRAVSGGATLGLFRARSHHLVPIPHCVVHAPRVNAAARAAEDALRHVGATAYNDVTGDGQCRYVLLTEGRAGVQVTFVWNARNWKESLPASRRVGAALWKTAGGGLEKGGVESVWFNWNVSAGNAIVSPERSRFYRMHGGEGAQEEVMGVPFYFPPYVFRQANLRAFGELLLPVLLRYVPKGGRVAEFCAGVGVIGLVALKERRLKKLVASEINAGAEEPFRRSYRALKNMGVVGTAKYVVGSDRDTAWIIEEGIQTVIVDPPRAGLTREFVKVLAEPQTRSLQRIIYVSCGFAAFSTDARLLCEGQWKLKHAHGFVLFPGSDHIETLAIFDRDANRPRTTPPRDLAATRGPFRRA